MKKIVVAMLGVATAATMAFGQTNQVLSRNAVGYIKLNIDKGDFAMIQNPFINLAGSDYTVTNLFGDQLPSGSSVFIWDEAGQTYVSENKGFGGWFPGTNVLDPGNGFFLTIGAAAPSNNYSIFMMGEVPDRFTQPTGTVPYVNGFSMVGYPFPVTTEVTNTTLAANLPSGSTVFLWDQAGQTYVSENKGFGGWFPGTNVLNPGAAFFLSTTVSTNWVEPKPYTWP